MTSNTNLAADDDRDRYQAEELDHQIRALVLSMKHDFLTLGELMLQMETTRGWILLTADGSDVYRSYEHWIQSLPHSRSLAFAAKRVAKELGPLVPRHLLVEIDQNKLELLRELARMAPRKVTPQVIEAAIEKDYKSFAVLVRQDAPIEPRHRLTFNCELSQAEKIEEILEFAATELTEIGEPIMGRTEALEMVLILWQQDHRQQKGVTP